MRKIFILICVFTQLLGIAKTYSQGVWDGASVDYSWYTGHESDPSYTISTANELAGLAWLVKDGGVSFAGKTINIGSDPANPVVIDLGGNTWTPIGYYASSSAIYPFRGSVNGNNCTIKNFRTSGSYRGLFGYVRSDTEVDDDILIQNINVEANISGTQYVGGICGYICGYSKKISDVNHYRRNAKIQNCTFNGTVSASSSDSYAGGIAGIAYYTEINACATAGQVSGTSYVGGIAGDAYSGSSNTNYKPIVENCVNSALISGAGANVGGILGYAYYAIVRYNLNAGCIFGNSEYTGGIIGNVATKSTVVSYCLNVGTVKNGVSEYASGSIVGRCGTDATSDATLTAMLNAITYSYSDSQLSPVYCVWGENRVDHYESRLTSEITGTSPTGLSGSDWASHWDFNDGYYPVPSPLALSNFAKLASAPIFLENNEIYNNVATDFTVCPDVSWVSNNGSNNPDFITLDGLGNATIDAGLHGGRAELVATYAGLSKVIIIDTRDNDALPDPLTIENLDELKDFRDAINGVAPDYKGAVSRNGFAEYNFVITNNIDLNNEEWEPIGTSTHPFCGYIDGGDYTISGLKITASEGYKGLFGYVKSGTIGNITVKGSLRGTTYLGGICGSIIGTTTKIATIYNCHFIGDITTTSTSSAYVGGICGYAQIYTEISACSATGNVISPNQKASYMGGIAGYFYGGGSTYTAGLNNCINLAEVSGNGYISGIAGCVSRYAEIMNNLNAGNVYGKTTTVGGIIGSSANANVVYVTGNINAATVNSGASVIGIFTDTNYDVAPENNYYDSQRSSLEDSRATGSTTSALVVLSLDGWTATDGYPLPEGFSNEDVKDVAKTIVTFSGSEIYNAVSTSFSLGTFTDALWVSDDETIVSISGTTATVTGELGNVVLTVSKDETDYYKKVLISVAIDEDPLTIASYLDLVNFRDAVNAGLEGSYKGHANNNGFAGVNFKVTGNIDMTDAENTWVAIGTSTNPFRGNFDGGSEEGYKFTNMTINASGSYTGLFGYVYPLTTSSTIENIDLSGTITAKSYSGAIVGYAKGTNAERNVTIDNCHFNGSLAGGSYVGGICGYAGAYTDISNCTSAGTKITGSSTSVGGICGYSTGNATTTNKISGCASMSKNLRGTGNVGGIVGYAQNTDVSYSVNAAIVNANNAVVGGIAGNVLSGATLTECFNFITVYEIGYIYGTNEGSDNITDCYYDSKFCVAGTANGTAKTTAEMIGLSLSSTNWTTGSGSYPKPKGIAERSETKVACAPITFTNSSEDNQNKNLPDSYNIYTTGGIEWTSPSDGTVITIGDGSVSMLTTTFSKIVMVAALDGWEKEIDLFNSVFGNLIEIHNYSELAAFRTAVNNGPSGEYNGVSATTGFAGKTVIITTDFSINANWVPIGTATYPFKGTFDGQGYTVSNLRHTSSSTPRGLFGYIENAEIRNLNVNTGTYTTKATTYGGGIVGNSVNSTIEDCSFNGQIASTSTWIGGIVGKMVSTTVRRCVTAGTITSSASNYVGGICGHASYGESASVIEDCASNMDIFGVSSVGGIAGYISNSTIQRCINAGNVSGQTNNVGGIVGYETDDMAVVANNLNTGTVYTGGGVIGFKHPDATATTNYYDNQRSVDLYGIAEVGEDGDPFDTGATETEDLIETLSLFASGWTESSGMYPVPSAISSHNAAKLAAVPVLFGTQKYNSVSSNFNVGTITGLTWISDNTDYILSISGSTVTVDGTEYNSATLTATYNGWKKTVPVLNPTDEDPLLISTLAELKNFRDAVNAGGSGSYKGVPNVAGFSGKDFKLTYSGDYDLNNEEWEPIGKSASYTFNGNLDGNGKNIINLSVNATDADYKGLFGYIIGGSIKNLNVKGDVAGKSYVGGICGYVKGANSDNYSAITNCTFNGNVTAATSYAGGMTGYNGNYTTIDTCRVAGTVTASTSYAGGITGTSVGTSSYRNALTSCTNAAKVSANTNYAGGIVGENTYSNVQYCNNGGDVSGSSYLTGGITGHNKNANVIYCISTAYINNGGAIIGYNESTATGNFYDKQRTSVKGISATDGTSADQSGKAVGLLTEAMTGETPSGISGDGWIPLHWTYVDGLYPISANLESDDFAVVTSIPIFLVANWNNVNDANSPFTVGNPTGTAWSLVNNTGYITISAPNATVEQVSDLNSEILVATLNGNVSKKFYVCDFENIPDMYIYTIAELKNFRDAVNNRGEGIYKGIINNDGYLGVTFILDPTETIDLTSENWIPIGSEQDKCFAGIFDGQNNEIQNLTIDYTNDFAGLFGYVNGGEIKNVTLTNVDITTSGSYAGAICGRIGGTAAAKYSPITNCIVDGTITSNNGTAGYVGGIAGYVNTYANIADCNANVNITAYSHAGGIAGYVNAANSDNNIIENCISSGSVTTSSTYAGGIVGYFKNDGLIYNCVNRGAVQASANAGGIAGRTDGADQGNLFCIVESCRNDNTVTATTTSSYAGGIVGYANTYVKIKKSANSGDVTAKKYTGGILGYSPSTVSAKHNAILNCTNSAVITGTTYVGGIFGSSTYTDVSYNNNGGNVHGTTSSYVGGIAGQNPASTTLLCNISTGTVMSSTVAENALVGTSSTGTITETYYDNQRMKPISENGIQTSQLIGTSPLALTGEGWTEENFVFSANMYPMPKGTETYPEAKLAATPIVLSGTEVYDSVFSTFNVGTENSVSWTSDEGHVEISGSTAGVTLKCTETADVVLTASITDEVTLNKIANIKLARVKLSPIAGQTAPYNVWVSVATSDDNDWTTSGNWLTYDGERYSNATAYPVDGANVILIHNDEQIENTCEFVSPVIDGDKLVGNILVGEDVTFDMGSNHLGVEGNATINGFIIGAVDFGEESGCDGEGYIDGPITKHGSSTFKFLTGHDGRFSAFEMTPAGDADVTVTYHSDNTGMLGGSMSGGLDHVSDIEYWHVVSNKTLASVRLYYGAGDHGIESAEIPHLEEDLRIAYSKGSEWINIGGEFVDGWAELFEGNRGYVTSTEGIPFGRDGGADVASGSLNAKDVNLLPIELVSFSASCNGTSVNVEWATASEKNNDYFILEKSYDAVNFSEIARIKGAGSSIVETRYSYTDNENYGGEMYYLLQQVDYDGTRTASEIIVAKCADYELDPTVTVFPNPFRSEVTLSLENFGNKPATVEVFNVMGTLVRTVNIDATGNNYETVLNLEELSAATYTIRISTTDFVVNKRVVKQ